MNFTAGGCVFCTSNLGCLGGQGNWDSRVFTPVCRSVGSEVLTCKFLAQSTDAANRLMLWSIVAFRGYGAIGWVRSDCQWTARFARPCAI